MKAQHFHCIRILSALLLAALSGVAASQQLPFAKEQLQELLEQLPAPQGSGTSRGGAEDCKKILLALPVESSEVSAAALRNTGKGTSAAQLLIAWGKRHFGERAFCSASASGEAIRFTNWRFLATEWQKALGVEVSGKLSQNDIELLVNQSKAATDKLTASLPENANTTAKIFGIPLGVTVRFPECTKNAKRFGNTILVERDMSDLCISSASESLHFSESDRPKWIANGVRIKMIGGVIHGALIRVTDLGPAYESLHKRFGQPKQTLANTVERRATADCIGGGCVFTPSETRTEYIQTWEGDGLVATLSKSTLYVRTLAEAQAEALAEKNKTESEERTRRSGRKL